MKYNKVNFLYRIPTSIYSSYMFFEGLKVALERNNLLYYSYGVGGKERLDMDKLLEYPIMCVNGSWEPVFSIVKSVSDKQFVAEINSEFLFSDSYFQKKSKFSISKFLQIKKYFQILKSSPRQRCKEFLEELKMIFKVGILNDRSYPYKLLSKRSKHIDLYFSGIEGEPSKCFEHFGKSCYWYISWAHVELLKDITSPISDKILFVGALHGKRKEFFERDKNKIMEIRNTVAKENPIENIKELCKLINEYRYTICPIGIIDQYMPGKIFEYMACKRLCFCYLPSNKDYTKKLQQLFEDGKEIVYFKDFPELEEKYQYFLKNTEEADQIAQAGCEKVRKYHNADVRARRFAEIVLHHANGGEYKDSYNNISFFGGKSL